MKVAVAFLAVVALANADVHLGHRMEEVPMEPRIFEGAINKSVECIRDLLANGDPEINLPPLDPLQLDDLAIDLDKYGWEHFTGQVQVNNAKVNGHLGWHLSNLKISPVILPPGVKITVDLAWANTDINADYKLDVNILDHTIRGEGSIAGSARNFQLEILATAGLGRINIRKLQINPSLEDISFSIGQLNVDGNEVSESINGKVGVLLVWVKENMPIIGERIAEAILNILNKKTRDARLDGILGAVANCIQL